MGFDSMMLIISLLPRYKVHGKSALTLASTLIHISRSLIEIPPPRGPGEGAQWDKDDF